MATANSMAVTVQAEPQQGNTSLPSSNFSPPNEDASRTHGELLQRLSAAISQAEAFSAQIGDMQAAIEELRVQVRDQACQARQEISERLVKLITEDAGKKVAQSIEAVTAEVMSEMRQRCSLEVLNQIRLTEGFLARATRELEARYEQMNTEAKNQLAGMLHEGLESFEQQLKETVQSFRESALTNISQECAARMAIELEQRQSHAGEQMKAQTQQLVRSALDGFQVQLQQMVDDFRKTTEPALADHCAARLAAKTQTKQEELIEQAKNEIQLALRSSLGGLQAELVQFEQGFRDFAVPALTQECIARSTAALHAEQEALQARAQEQMRQIASSAHEELRSQIDQTRKNFLDVALPALARECVERSAGELEQARRYAVKQATAQIDGAARLSLRAFSEQLRAAEEHLNNTELENLLKLSAEQINQYVQETLARARNDFAVLRGNLIHEARTQLAILERAALPSLQTSPESPEAEV